MKVISLGWGVQSWAMVAMSALGKLPKVDVAIHSDTGLERDGTKQFAKKWTPWLEKHGIEVVTVQANPNGREGLFTGKEPGYLILPAFTSSVDGGSNGQLRRGCAKRLKIMPVRSWLFKHKSSEGIDLWLGISKDERVRVKESLVKYIHNCYPLVIEGYTRQDLVDWLVKVGLDVPQKSTCVCCPYHSMAVWKEIRACAADWTVAVEVDEYIRARTEIRFACYVHRKRIPLSEVSDF